MFTSRYPNRIGVVEGFYCHKFRMEKLEQTGQATLPLNRIPGSVATLPEVFRAAGYATFGLSANINIGEEIGFDRGLDSFERINDAPAEVFHQKLAPLKQKLPGSAPFLLYLHFNDVHSPYHAREPYYVAADDPKLDSRAKYISEIGYVDEYIGKCMDSLEPDDNTVVMVVSDHGEEFWDHGSNGHRPRLYRELTQVLMMIHAPFLGSKTQRVSVNVSLMDVLPTLAELSAVEAPQGCEGVSLAGLLTRGSQAQSLSERLQRRMLFAHRIADTPQQQLWSAIHKHWNFIEWPAGQKELFDHRIDPAERNNVLLRHNDVSGQLSAKLADFKKTGPIVAGDRVQVEMNEELLENLKSLGYVE
jgi:arylsulfatase A-like enzyme